MQLPSWFPEHCDKPFDIDAELKEIADCDHEQNSLRVLALLSIGLPADEAYLRSRELLEAVQWSESDIPAGKRQLAALLGANENDYQRAVYFALAGRGAIAMLSDLQRLTNILESRYLLSIAADNYGVELSQPFNPYLTDKPDGPSGTFDPDYTLSDIWDGIGH
ncbi:MAG: hypothetical protein RL481_1956 [Pseudomonadota bacterium]